MCLSIHGLSNQTVEGFIANLDARLVRSSKKTCKRTTGFQVVHLPDTDWSVSCRRKNACPVKVFSQTWIVSSCQAVFASRSCVVYNASRASKYRVVMAPTDVEGFKAKYVILDNCCLLALAGKKVCRRCYQEQLAGSSA